MRKINIYAPTYRQASDLAAKMNLALRHWEYAAAGGAGAAAWADVGSIMDEYQQLRNAFDRSLSPATEFPLDDR